MFNFIIGIVVFFVLLMALGIRPVNTSRSNSISISGTVEGLYEGGVKDIVFRIKEDNRRFYINRGLECGFTLKGLRDSLLGNNIKIWYAKHWTILDPSTRTNHITRVVFRDSVIFDEWDLE